MGRSLSTPGRLHRLYDGKREVRIYDYADLNVPMLGRMFDRRCRGYEAIGYTVLLPASAIPGWPADVIAAFGSRVEAGLLRGASADLIRDGVDIPLASLFVHAARPVSPDAEGRARARAPPRHSSFDVWRLCRRRKAASR